ncbi:MAG: type II secretion system protein [Pyrinomonadaceae bacterium]|nr:type II secretion system protein [Pyrinomonadaceae bacterium]
MKKPRRHMHDESGISLPEVLIVTVIVAIVASLALLQFGSSREQLRRQNVAQQLKQAFERARFDSVKRRAVGGGVPYAAVIVDSDSYTLVLDLNADGDTTDPGETTVTSFTNQTIIPGPGSSASLPVTISFDKRGEVAAATPIFMVCNVTPCSLSDNTPGKANVVVVTPTGTVNLLGGGVAIPTFTAPTLSPVGSGSGINEDVTMP